MLFIVTAVACSLVTVISYTVYLVICYFYDYKHLRRFQNLSTFSGVTDLPWIVASIRLKRFKDLHEAHKTAKIVRVGQNILSFNDVRAASSIYGHGSPSVKAPYYDAGAGHYRNLADTRSKPEHSQKRRILAAGYALTTLLRWEDKVMNRIHALVGQYDVRCLSRGVSTPEDISLDHRRWMDLFTIDIINDIGLSAGMKLLEKADDSFEVRDSLGHQYSCRFRESLWKGLEVHTSYAWWPQWYSLVQKLTWWDKRWQHGAAYNDIVTTQCKRRLERYMAGEKLDDFFTYLLESKGNTMNMLSLGEMIAECSVMLNAGSETTGIALTNCLYLLISNPRSLAQLRSEVDPAFASDGEVCPSFEKVRYLPYLKACIDEGLRLHPPSATTTPRITPPEGQQIADEWIAGNTVVLCPTYTLHRNSEVFEEPDQFRPERWLEEGAKDLQRGFLPFSAGARGCIGRNITYMEQQMLIATLVHRYEFELISSEWRPSYTEAVTCSPGPMPLRIYRR